MNEDDDNDVVAQACLSVAQITKDFGYVAVESHIHQLVDSTLALLWQTSACQVISGIDIEDDDTKHSEVLMDAVTDLLPAFAKAMGSNFAPFFKPQFDPLMVLMRVSDSPQDRTMVVACLAEVAQHMGTSFSCYTLMSLVLRELDSPSANQ